MCAPSGHCRPCGSSAPKSKSLSGSSVEPGSRSWERAISETLAYVQQRHVFGAPLMAMQNTRFKLAECQTQATIARSFVDDLIGASFKVKNPKATASCGCGTSFSL